ncbi:MAG: TIGR02186 family protein [Deltaproteobacteria bacterium]|nr:TIGR02186 family protein [Deltaproteobacteria bacterium]
MEKKLRIADCGLRNLKRSQVPVKVQGSRFKVQGSEKSNLIFSGVYLWGLKVPALIGLGLIILLVTGHFAQAGTLTFQPAGLERTLFSKRFHDLTISGSAPEGAQIILKIISPTKDFNLNKSGKGLGFVWLPISHAEVKKLSGMYALLSSGKISGLLPPDQQKALGLSPDYQEIYKQAEIHYKTPPKADEAAGLKKEYMAGLIKILEEGGLYQVKEDAVRLSGNQFTAQVKHAADAPLGEYRVYCYAVKEGKAELLAQEKFQVKQTGLAEWLTRQAASNAVVYGIMAALIAIGAGILVGLIFKKGGGH